MKSLRFLIESRCVICLLISFMYERSYSFCTQRKQFHQFWLLAHILSELKQFESYLALFIRAQTSQLYKFIQPG
jgi:hypothetical protein